MPDLRWQYLIEHRASNRRKISQVVQDLTQMGFVNPVEALEWFVSEFERVDPSTIYGCGPCCNDFILPFIRNLERLSGQDMNEIVVRRFDHMTTQEKQSVIDSYRWFFGVCGDEAGWEKLKELEDSLSHTVFFQEIRAANDAAMERDRLANDAAMERARLARIRDAYLASFIVKETDLVGRIKEHRQEIIRIQQEHQQEIIRIQSEIGVLDGQLQNVRRAKDREWELHEFERLSVNEQLEVLIGASRPMAYYEGRLSKILDECEFSQLSKDAIGRLLAGSRSAKHSKLPQVATLHKLLKQSESR